MDQENKKRRGPAPKPEDQQRNHRISIFLTAREYTLVKQKAGDYKLPDYVRTCAIDGAFAPKPSTIPKINLAAWKKLGRTTNNLNQLVRHLHTFKHINGLVIDIAEVNKILGDFRTALIIDGSDHL